MLSAYKIIKALFMLSVIIGVTIAAVCWIPELKRSAEYRSEIKKAATLKTHRITSGPFEKSQVTVKTKMRDGYTLQYRIEFRDLGSIGPIEKEDIIFVEFLDSDKFSQHYIEIKGKQIYEAEPGLFTISGTDKKISRETYLSATDVALYLIRDREIL